MTAGNYRVEWFPGLGLGIICDDCTGEARDVTGFDRYDTSLDVREIQFLIMEHELVRHPERTYREH